MGLDKKLYLYDSGIRRPSFCIPYESPFSSLAFGDNGHILAAGTGNGRIVFYDVRGVPLPVTVLHAYSSSEVNTFFILVQSTKHFMVLLLWMPHFALINCNSNKFLVIHSKLFTLNCKPN